MITFQSNQSSHQQTQLVGSCSAITMNLICTCKFAGSLADICPVDSMRIKIACRFHRADIRICTCKFAGSLADICPVESMRIKIACRFHRTDICICICKLADSLADNLLNYPLNFADYPLKDPLNNLADYPLKDPLNLADQLADLGKWRRSASASANFLDH